VRSAGAPELRAEHGVWLAYLGERPVGCVVLRTFDSIPSAGECKRLYHPGEILYPWEIDDATLLQLSIVSVSDFRYVDRVCARESSTVRVAARWLSVHRGSPLIRI
jgi:hypothetical protein